MLLLSAAWAGTPPAQKLPSALLVYPFVQAGGGQDTRIEIVNLSGNPQEIECFYVSGCGEVGFFLFLTPYQPAAWLASTGSSNVQTGTDVPPFFGTGEMRCGVQPSRPELSYHNTIQGRATVFGSDGETISYGAIGFQRLSPGDFTGTYSLDGQTYAQCPDKLHFDVLTDQPSSSSDLVLIPCTEDLQMQMPTTITAQLLIYNEFEQSFSSSVSVTCFDQRALSDVTTALTRAIAGTDTAHLVVRGVGGPFVGLVIDRVPFRSVSGTAGNEPSFDGGRSAQVVFP